MARRGTFDTPFTPRQAASPIRKSNSSQSLDALVKDRFSLNEGGDDDDDDGHDGGAAHGEGDVLLQSVPRRAGMAFDVALKRTRAHKLANALRSQRASRWTQTCMQCPHAGCLGVLFDRWCYMPLYRCLARSTDALIFVQADAMCKEPEGLRHAHELPAKVSHFVRVVIVGRTLGKHAVLTLPAQGDVLIHLGADSAAEAASLAAWMGRQPFACKLLLGGGAHGDDEAAAKAACASAGVELVDCAEVVACGLCVFATSIGDPPSQREVARLVNALPRHCRVFASRGTYPLHATGAAYPKLFCTGPERGGSSTLVRRALSGAVHTTVSVCDQYLRPVNPFVVCDVPAPSA